MGPDPLFGAEADWKWETLGQLCARGGGDVQTGPFGSQLHAADYVPVGIPSIMPQNIGENRVVEDGIARIAKLDAERLARYCVKPGDIVYSRRGDVERRALIRARENGWLCGTGCLRVRVGTGADPVYTSYYLGHPAVREWIVRHAHGATMPNLNTGILSSLPFLVPPITTQRAIAHILGSLDDKIDLNRRMNETLEALARAIFKSWFVDFDPVRAKTAGRKPVGMDAETAALFPDRMQESEMGEIPAGWRYWTLGDLVDLTRGTTYKGSLRGLPGPALLGLASIQRNGGFREDNLSTYGGDSPENLVLGPGDLFASLKDVTQTGDLLGAVARVPRYVPRGRLTQDTVKLTFRHAGTSQHLVYRTLLGAEYRAYCRAHATGTTNLGLSRDDFLAFPIIGASDHVQSAFDELMDIIEARSSNALSEFRTLAALRDALLPKLLSGALRVGDAEGLARGSA